MKGLFIHIPKNAGTSIRKSSFLKNKISFPQKHQLQPGYLELYLKKMKKINEAQGIDHARWRDISDELKKLQSFAIVRNPWAKVSKNYWAKNR